ncbi:Conotoxin LiC42 [Orchesella cincta]|uniref:Conotoxin LiC42 n=1 Tax=Orchesella cincta TaxID=48709 RepID=A0A1D2N3D1_ORCCI|nr:Conotoxin LiC42 [Orchesella cincta]
MFGTRLTVAVAILLVVTASLVLAVPASPSDVTFESLDSSHSRIARQAMRVRASRTCSNYGESCASRPCCEQPTGDIVCYNFNRICGPLL